MLCICCPRFGVLTEVVDSKCTAVTCAARMHFLGCSRCGTATASPVCRELCMQLTLSAPRRCFGEATHQPRSVVGLWSQGMVHCRCVPGRRYSRQLHYVLQVTTKIREHQPVEKQFVRETRPVGECQHFCAQSCNTMCYAVRCAGVGCIQGLRLCLLRGSTAS